MKRFRKNKKTPPFAKQSCRQRKKVFIQIKNDIRRAAPHLGGLFFTHDYMHGKNGWIDCWFIGKNKTVYNVTLETTAHAYKEAVGELAMDRSYELVPMRDTVLFEKVERVNGHVLTEMKFIREVHEEFDGLERYEWMRREEQRIAEARCVKVHEKVTLHHDYACGVGLHATIDVPYLTVEAVNAFIRKFIANGEKAYQKSEGRTFDFAELDWGLEPNAIAYPWDCPPDEGAHEDGNNPLSNDEDRND